MCLLVLTYSQNDKLKCLFLVLVDAQGSYGYTHFCDSCGKYTISDNVLVDHKEFYSDTEVFSTHANCDLCGKYIHVLEFYSDTAERKPFSIL